MSETFVVFKREFEAMVRTKMFVIGTVIVPLVFIAIFAFQFYLFTRTGGGSYSLVIVDETEDQVGTQIERALGSPIAIIPGAKPVTFRSEVMAASTDSSALRKQLEARVQADSLDGYLWLPPGTVTGATAEYVGRNATNSNATDAVKQALQRSVQTIRLGKQGIRPEQVSAALQPVRMRALKSGEGGVSGSAELAQVLGAVMGFAIYFIVAIYGAGVLNGVLEEKRDRIVEVIVSSVSARHLLIGKIFGIGTAGLLQMVIWILTIFIGLKWGPDIVQLFGVSKEKAEGFSQALTNLPRVPTSVTLIFLFYFLGGFFIYSTMYAMLGSIATTNQEAQQLVFPVMMPLILGFLMLQPSLTNPDSGVAIAGSMIPFTAPLIMPARNVISDVPVWQLALSMALLVGSTYLMIWMGAKIYRIGIFATGKRASMKEVWRWVRTV